MSESAIDSFKLCIIFTGYIPIIPILTGGSDGSGGSGKSVGLADVLTVLAWSTAVLKTLALLLFAN